MKLYISVIIQASIYISSNNIYYVVPLPESSTREMNGQWTLKVGGCEIANFTHFQGTMNLILNFGSVTPSNHDIDECSTATATPSTSADHVLNLLNLLNLPFRVILLAF